MQPNNSMQRTALRAAADAERWYPHQAVVSFEPMEPDTKKIDAAVLALMYLTLHDGCRAWKSFDWEATDRLHQQGLIENPANKAKSVVLTERGLKEAERLFNELLGTR